jgi:hypothetical protein
MSSPLELTMSTAVVFVPIFEMVVARFLASVHLAILGMFYIRNGKLGRGVSSIIHSREASFLVGMPD